MTKSICSRRVNGQDTSILLYLGYGVGKFKLLKSFSHPTLVSDVTLYLTK